MMNMVFSWETLPPVLCFLFSRSLKDTRCYMTCIDVSAGLQVQGFDTERESTLVQGIVCFLQWFIFLIMAEPVKTLALLIGYIFWV